ncbi:hypothetical protein [Streptomyces sp. NPDC050535]|uniref:hypothetical protein n=1 Tax=Streptomyces sp. NPDC050535 TaxID=3365626 RepID=UPI0037A36A32
MNRRPSRVLASALTAGVLVSASACSSVQGVEPTNERPTVSSAAPSSPAAKATSSLTVTQARDALLGPAELGERWSATQGGATWRDGLLKGRTDTPDCQRLLDGLYAEDLLGEPKGVGAVVGLDESDTAAQLRYQVAAYGGPAEVDAKMAWLRTLPVKCAEFTSTDVRGGRQTVRVEPAALPGVGDAREGLRMTVSAEGDLYGETPTLTLDFAAVRVGDRAVTLTNGGLGGAEKDFTAQAVQLGTQRLHDVLTDRPPATRPSDRPTDRIDRPTAQQG